MHRVPLAQREYLDVRVVGKTPRPAETTTRHCQPGGEGHTFGADSESEFLGLQLWASTPVASPAALRHHPRQEPRALTRMRGSVRGDWRKPVPYRDGSFGSTVSEKSCSRLRATELFVPARTGPATAALAASCNSCSNCFCFFPDRSGFSGS